ncbi:MAG: transglutaminase domain-containing protein, partial [bacterium]|nr:transglutaminase domain-containing protein [bacterium]
FRENFKYSLINAGKGHSKTALENFLLVSRSGHCEYFATATVLLLRACGLPARYVTGYSAQEYSPLEEKIVVRAKHAHAWTQVYLKGKWQTLDTTPESHHDGDDGFSIFKWGSDWIAFIKFKLLQWRWKIFGNLPLLYLFLPMIPFFFFLLRRAFRKKKKKSTGRVQKKTTAPPLPIKRTNSEFHLMEQKMKALGLERSHGETRYRWLQRLEEQLSSRVKAQTSSSIIQLHYRDRFSAQSLTALQKDLLKKQIKVFMDGIDEREGIDEHRDIEESEA